MWMYKLCLLVVMLYTDLIFINFNEKNMNKLDIFTKTNAEVFRMKKDDLDQAESELMSSSLLGAKEDIIHKSHLDEGHDLRVANPFGTNKKQESE